MIISRMTGTLIWFVILILLSGFFSGTEIAFFSLSRGRVRTMVRQKLQEAKFVEQLKANPQRLLVVILIGNNLVNIFAAALATRLAIEVFGSLGVGIATGVVTFLVLVFGEIFPKALAQAHAGVIARYAARPILILQYVLFPVVVLLEKLSGGITKLFPKSQSRAAATEEEIRSLLHIGVEEGAVERHEHEFVERLFRFNDLVISSVMTPIKKVVMLDGDLPIDQVSHFVANSRYSRFPVYQGAKGNIIGLVSVKAVFQANQSQHRDRSLANIVKPLITIPVEEELDGAYRLMRQKKAHAVLVRNQRGQTVGLATIEDILDQLVGELHH